MISKGIVYCLLGALAFMAAFDIAGHSDEEANRKGVFRLVQDAPGGPVLLGIIAAGLICYCFWRGVQAFLSRPHDKPRSVWSRRVRYLGSGLTYASVAFTAVKMIGGSNSHGDSKQKTAQEALQQPFGEWALILGALALAAVGIYQGWYGLSEKYRNHVQKLNLQKRGNSLLLLSGKIGYVARGIVWLLLAFLMMRAALHRNAGEAGDTGKAFRFVESAWGSPLLAILGAGLIAYGIFNFIRARFEQID